MSAIDITEVQMTLMNTVELRQKVRAVVQFGPATGTSGYRAGEYFQVIVDPNMKSPDGEYIRFGHYPGDELVGWQRVSAMTIATILEENPNVEPLSREGYTEEATATVKMRKAA